MGEMTELRPKCLVSIAGQPLLSWTLRSLRANGIERVLIVTGWKSECLTGWSPCLRFNPRWHEANMVRSLQLAADWLDSAPTLVVYGDGAYGADAIRDALTGPQAHLTLPVDSQWLSLWQRRFVDPLDDAEVLQFREGYLTRIGFRPASLQDIEGQYMGLLRTSPTGWRWISTLLDRLAADQGEPMVDRLDMTSLLQRLIEAGRSIACVEVAGGWVEIDSPQDAAVVEAALSESGFSHDFRA
jgi:choline kinase